MSMSVPIDRTVAVRAGVLTMVLVWTFVVASPGAHAAGCAYPARFPGEGASTVAIAAWMATRASERGVPGELPVMAALVRSGLRNQTAGGQGRAGYFGMLQRLWEAGSYAGFPADPAIQMDWFINQMIAIRDRAIFLGALQFGERTSQWGEWIAAALVARDVPTPTRAAWRTPAP
jgi:hypothetical protein